MLTKYSQDTLINLISCDGESSRRHKARAEENGYQFGVEYWQKELDDLEKLSEELNAENIIGANNGQSKPKGLVIRYFGGGFYLCDGKPMEGHENDGELWVGNAVKWFETWEEADTMRKIIDAAYNA